MTVLIDRVQFTIRWGDMDAYGHLNNTAYFLYLQEARFELMRKYNLIYDGSVPGPILLSTNFNFKRQITYPAIIVVETHLIDIERKKVTLRHSIHDANTSGLIYGDGEALVIWYDF